MKILTLIPVFLSISFSGIPQANDVVRGFGSGSKEVPLATDAYGLSSGVGLATRAVDHAAVAMNDNRDIVVTYHASRTNIPGTGGINLKQVELAYYEYQNIAGTDTWVFLDTVLLGSLHYNPVGGLNQVRVKCERPDIVAVGDKFFVVWTRRYEDSITGQSNGPAVLECAWVEKATNPNYKIQTYPDYKDPLNLTPGLGFELDAHVVAAGTRDFFVKECAGVPDAVTLSDSGLTSNEYKVAVAYPHQTQFSGAGSTDRKFELRMVTCTFNQSTKTITKGPFQDLHSDVLFNGPSSPGGGASEGLILPDLAPSSIDNSFWMAAETQTMTGGLPNGRIRLEYWELDSANNWVSPFGTTYKSPAGGTPFVRRRPNLSSYPPTSSSQGEQLVSIAFNKVDPDPLAIDKSSQVIYKEVVWQNGSTLLHLPVNVAWPNSAAFSDGKPVPLRGRDSPYIRRCFADRTPIAGGPPCDIMSFDDITEVVTSIDGVTLPDDGGVGRPAADYHYHSGASAPDYIPVTWERHTLDTDPLRIWLGVE